MTHMKVEIKYPKAKCKWCGAIYEKTHNRQQYCTKECAKKAKEEQDQKHRLKWVNKNKERLYQTQLGTRTIGPKPNPDPEREAEIVQNERKRLGLRIS